jgi:hypothetical protein
MDDTTQALESTLWERFVGWVCGFAQAEKLFSALSEKEENRLPEELQELTQMATLYGADCLEPGTTTLAIGGAWSLFIK